MEEQRNQEGRFTPEHTDAEILAAVRTHEPAATSEVAGEVGMTRQGADRRLRRLRDEGRVNSKKIGASLVWFAPDATAGESGRESATAAPRSQARGESDDARDGAHGDTRTESDDLADEVRRYLEEQDKPPKTTHGRDAVIDVFRQLREHGTRSTGDLQAEVYPAYADHWGSERAMWNALDRYLEGVPGIEKGGYGEWAYAGDDVVREVLGDAGIGMGGGYDSTGEF